MIARHGARGRAQGPSQELVDDAVALARVRGDLPDEARERLTGELIDELLAGRRSEAEIVGPGGLLGELTQRLVDLCLSLLPSSGCVSRSQFRGRSRVGRGGWG